MMELLPELTMIPSLSPPFFNLLPASALAANYQTSPKSNGRSSHGSSDVLEKDEKLCDYYRRMPVLYDKSHPHYKFQSKKEKAWRELSRLCEMDVEQCKKRMTYFRCRFTVERRIMKNGVNCSEWPLLEKLKFLNKHIKIRRPRAPNGEPDDTDDETNPMNILRKRQREQQEDVKDDLHAYLDLQQMAVAAQNSQAQLHYQQHLKLQGHGPFGAPPGAGFPSAHDPMSLHHLQPPHPHQRDHQLPPPHSNQPGGGGSSQSGGPPGQQQVPHSTPLGASHHHHHPFGRSGMPGSASGGHHQHHHAHGPGGASGSAAAAALQHGAGGGTGSGHPHHHQQPTPVESPIPAAMSNVEVSYGLPKRARVSYDGDEASLSNFNLNRTVKYQNNLEHQAHLDEHGAYGLYVGEVLRKLPERISSLTSLKIMQLLYEAQVQSFDAAPPATPKPTSQSKVGNGEQQSNGTTGGGGGGGGAGAATSSSGSLPNGGGTTSVASSEGGRQSTESAESMSNKD
ncbi:lateral signaling target protein 2 homolog isoform X2 [Anopheles funestus]|uniref:MADF domain-containing protein n=1 Tax=Anopheles funestus TaxID=62324 RepID=A0A4Y0BFJ6_ANOFN|nr:lateral signaling target protein 2 homolog isoform X2 [Anopheles funestus]XP_049297482.1 lateral signaling target protein 2 homolog isoform X2 [Anopheles funestus]XP_049297483.1 lateral signaling target protein 2 homolog isoform X2 [Anopheles funestus]XP_049297484.1 lateral signaling target protein 2 homolog isoform X2 [Anopheles funestus]